MANAVDFEGTNIKLTAPDGDEDRVTPLRAFQNGHVVVTAWELTDLEIAEIIRTRRIFVGQLSGRTIHPTVVGTAEQIRAMCIDYGKTFPRQEL